MYFDDSPFGLVQHPNMEAYIKSFPVKSLDISMYM